MRDEHRAADDVDGEAFAAQRTSQDHGAGEHPYPAMESPACEGNSHRPDIVRGYSAEVYPRPRQPKQELTRIGPSGEIKRGLGSSGSRG